MYIATAYKRKNKPTTKTIILIYCLLDIKQESQYFATFPAT